MREGSATLIRRENYTAPAYWIRTVDLTFDLDPAKTVVLNRMTMERNTAEPAQPLKLNGEGLNLLRVLVNGESVSFRNESGLLVIDGLPEGVFELEIKNTCAPDKNTSLTGLYTSGGGFFTQCEAEGFRNITYFLDRPDVMAVYTVTLRANKARYPVLLSNGNLVAEGDVPGSDKEGPASLRHFAKWHDPFRKPCYLFALVAADLVTRELRIRTRAGRDHLLQVHVRRGDLEKTEHAMNSLVASVVWDEARFKLPLDLERFMIVAVGDFNMGAMENKGLNIFNTKFVLANPATATDGDYSGIESVVGHEYFHNWTGNRITCRDWFQLSLKEGLTVFRDQEFSQDMAGSPSARAVKRIEDVRQLRQAQFPEDAGPMAHPVRPDSYVEINNFYTATVYDKGAEVVRMMQTLVGREGFERGMTLYFERFDGQAVTCDDFAQSIADANPDSELARQLTQFKRWYAQAGTPRVCASGYHDADARTYTLEVSQQSEPSAGQPRKEPFVIPLAVGLLGRDGRAMALRLEGESTPESETSPTERVLVLNEASHRFVFVDIDQPPVASLLRGFSAPVILTDGLSDADLLCLLQHDSDAFNRWEAGQRLALARLLAAVRGEGPLALDEAFVTAMRALLREPGLDAAFKELVLTLPSEGYVAEQLDVVDPQAIHRARETMRLQLAQALKSDWQWAFETHQVEGAYSPDPMPAGRRALANLALSMLCLEASNSAPPDADAGASVQAQAQAGATQHGKAYQRFKNAANMTDRMGALAALVNAHAPLAQPALAQFRELFKDEALVIDKWFALQAGAPEKDGLVFERAGQLLAHPDFSLKNPNRARSLISAFCAGNPGAFHRADGKGYEFWADRVLELDSANPQLAARMARVMDRWSKFAAPYRDLARGALARVATKPDLSSDVREVVSRALAVAAA